MSFTKRLRAGVECAPWVIEEVEKLEAELAALKGQEPVGHLTLDGDFIQNQRWCMQFGVVPKGKALYLEAGAQTAPAGHVLLSEDAVKMTLNCLCTPERANLRLVLRDLNKAMLAAAPVQAGAQAQAQEQPKPPTALSSK